jgi:DNA topoisomerase IB
MALTPCRPRPAFARFSHGETSLPVQRVHRIDPNGPGLARRRRGRGFAYVGRGGSLVTDDETLERIHALAIPPAWHDVWISPDPLGHIQAVGVDAAGRRQYRYHDQWRARRDREKHRRVERFGYSLPKLRARVGRDLRRPGLPPERVLGGAVRLLDRSALRIGGEEYARKNGSYGLATLRRDHLQIRGSRLELHFNGKAGIEHLVRVNDRLLARLFRELLERDARHLLAWSNGNGWHEVRAEEINDYVRNTIGPEFSAKDFRTWHATVLAASLLASHQRREGRRAVTAVIQQVAAQLGNTPAVCRSAYIDPRIIDRFLDEDRTIEPRRRGLRATEEAVLSLLADN